MQWSSSEQLLNDGDLHPVAQMDSDAPPLGGLGEREPVVLLTPIEVEEVDCRFGSAAPSVLARNARHGPLLPLDPALVQRDWREWKQVVDGTVLAAALACFGNVAQEVVVVDHAVAEVGDNGPHEPPRQP